MTTRTPDIPYDYEDFTRRLNEIGDHYHRLGREYPDHSLDDRMTAIAVATGHPLSTVRFFVTLMPDVEFDDVYPHYAPPPGL